MIGGKPDTLTARTLAWFDSNGPATRAELAKGLDVDRAHADATVTYLSREGRLVRCGTRLEHGPTGIHSGLWTLTHLADIPEPNDEIARKNSSLGIVQSALAHRTDLEKAWQ